MSNIQIKDLKPGKKYKLVIEPETEFDTITSYPAIEFTVPLAPPSAKKNDLSITSELKDITVFEDRIVVNNASIKYRPRGGNKREIKVVGTTPHGLLKNDIIDITGIFEDYNVSSAVVLAVYTDRNSFEYNDTTSLIESDNTWTTDTIATVTEKNGTAKVKSVPVVNIKIPDAVLNNLIWNDSVRDFVHIVFRSGDDKTDISGPRYYVNSNGVELGTSPRDMNSSPDLDSATYDYGMPKIATKQISDKKYYEFQYIIARYIRAENNEWQGQWLEPGPNKNRLSNPVSWGA